MYTFLILYKLGIVKLADFGFAKTLEYGASLAESFCGTLIITFFIIYVYCFFFCHLL